MKGNILVLTLCFLGSIVRIYFATSVEPWNEAPDHLAWEIVLSQNQWLYRYLIHYPHEGGTVLISLFAKFISLFAKNHLLSTTTLLIDFLVRLIQLLIIKAIWGKRVMILFGIWSIFTISALLPWSSVNFGLHYISSVFPFLFLWLLKQKQGTWMGLFLGLSVWLHYSNLVLLIAFLLYVLIFDRYNKRNYLGLSITLIVLLGHFAVKEIVDPGFQLLELSNSSIRGVGFYNLNTGFIKAFFTFFTNNLKSLYYAGQAEYIVFFGYVWLFTLLIGFGTFIIKTKKSAYPQINFAAFFVVLIFLILYAYSPFYPAENTFGYIGHRHVSYILPLFILFAIKGFESIPLKKIGISLFALLMLASVVSTLNAFKRDKAILAERPTGWVLGTKFGHNPKELGRIISNSKYESENLTVGAFWGITSAIFNNCDSLSEEKLDERTKLLFQIIDDYELESCDSFGGVTFALGDNVSPRTCFSVKKKIYIANSNYKFDN